MSAAVGARLPDHTLALARDGYEFLTRRTRPDGADGIAGHLVVGPAVFIKGAEAARAFYDEANVERAGAMPARVRHTLLGNRGVMSLDGEAHRHRKALLLSFMTPQAIDRLVSSVERHWTLAEQDWASREQVVLLDAVAPVLTAAACEWVGVPLERGELPRRTSDLRALVEAPAAVGPRHWRGRRARARTDGWVSDLVEQARDTTEPPGSTPLEQFAHFRDLDGRLLDARVAAVDVINLLRPITALDRYVTFCAVALHTHPWCRDALQRGGEADLEHFVHEVRRLAPFFPMTAGRARRPFDVDGVRVEPGDLVLLDLYATNRDADVWADPERFDPERFRGREVGAFDLVPQGGGDHREHHRCAGEWVTVAVMKAATRRLLAMRYDVPPQDLRVSRRRIPARPADGFVLRPVPPTSEEGSHHG